MLVLLISPSNTKPDMWSYVLVPLNPVAMDFSGIRVSLVVCLRSCCVFFSLHFCPDVLLYLFFIFFFLFVEEEEVVTPLLRAINLNRDLF